MVQACDPARRGGAVGPRLWGACMFHEILQASVDGAHEVGHQSHLRLPNKDEPALIQTYFPGVLDNVDCDVTRPCVAILPGGAYAFASAREAEQVALQMVAWGLPPAWLPTAAPLPGTLRRWCRRRVLWTISGGMRRSFTSTRAASS